MKAIVVDSNSILGNIYIWVGANWVSSLSTCCLYIRRGCLPCCMQGYNGNIFLGTRCILHIAAERSWEPSIKTLPFAIFRRIHNLLEWESNRQPVAIAVARLFPCAPTGLKKTNIIICHIYQNKHKTVETLININRKKGVVSITELETYINLRNAGWSEGFSYCLRYDGARVVKLNLLVKAPVCFIFFLRKKNDTIYTCNKKKFRNRLKI